MKPFFALSPPPRRVATGGSAIIIALLMVTLVTVIVLAAFVKSDSSRKVSRFGKDAGLASLYAQDGVAQAVALLSYATGAPSIPWSSQPGQIVRYTPDGEETVALHSGPATSTTTGGNLNLPSIQNPSEGTLLGDSNTPLLAQWIYVRENGERSLDNTYNASNRIIGRYAFWTDDEGAKLNVNTAWSESTTLNAASSSSHPSRLPLARAIPSLETDDLEAIGSYRASSKYFNTTLELLKGLGTGADAQASAIREAKFHLTPVNASPSAHLTSFGEPKIVLTTYADRAKAADGTQLPYLDIDDQATVRARISSYLARSDWSVAPGESFHKKYYGGEAARLDQLAGNIIDYVRCKELPDEIIKPSRYSPTGITKIHAPPTRRWRIVEAGFWRSTATSTQGRLYIVAHLPRHAGLASFRLENWRVSIIVSSSNAQNLIFLPTTVLKAGDYALLTAACTVPATGTVFSACLKFLPPDARRQLRHV